MPNLDSILKSRDVTLPTKVHLVQSMVFPVVIYGCESWTIKKAEHRRIDAFELMLEKTLESPLDCKEIQPVHPNGDQSWVFTGRTDVEAETPVIGHLMRRAHSLETTQFSNNLYGQRIQTRVDIRICFWAPKSLQMVTSAMKLKDVYSLEEKLRPTWTAYSKAETLLCQQRSV